MRGIPRCRQRIRNITAFYYNANRSIGVCKASAIAGGGLSVWLIQRIYFTSLVAEGFFGPPGPFALTAMWAGVP